jgi:transcriptional regulator with XRE-family HTH domain
MSVGKRIKAARESAGWSQSKLGHAVNQAPTTISSWERGRTEPGRDDVRRVAEALRLTAAELELEDRSTSRTVPLVGYVGAGDAAHYYAEADNPNEYVPAPEDATENTVAGEVRGPSLGPLFERWLLFWDEVRTPVTSDLYGRLCVVGLPDGRILVKQIQPAGKPNHFHLISNANEPPMFDQEVIWAARVTNLKPR